MVHLCGREARCDTTAIVLQQDEDLVVTWKSLEAEYGIDILDSKTGDTRHVFLEDHDHQSISNCKFVGEASFWFAAAVVTISFVCLTSNLVICSVCWILERNPLAWSLSWQVSCRHWVAGSQIEIHPCGVAWGEERLEMPLCNVFYKLDCMETLACATLPKKLCIRTQNNDFTVVLFIRDVLR